MTGERTGRHDTRVSSVGIREVGELDMDKLNGWIGNLLRTKGTDIYRFKGIFAIKGMENKFVFHGQSSSRRTRPHAPFEAVATCG